MYDYKICSVCNGWVSGRRCNKSDGTIIDCDNLGNCVRCGYNYYVKRHANLENNTGNCVICGTHLIETLENSYVYNAQNNQYTFTTKFKILDSNIHILDGSAWMYDEVHGFKPISITNSRNNGIETIIAIMEPVNKYPGILNYYSRIYYQYGSNVDVNSNICFNQSIIPETAKSEIQDIKITDIGESQGWTKQKQITVKGMDNWSNNVKISMQNSSGI